MHIFRKSTNTNAFGAYSYFGVTAEGHVYHWLMIHSAPIGAAFDPRTARAEIVGLTRTQDNISPTKVDQFMADKLQRTFNGTAPTPIHHTAQLRATMAQLANCSTHRKRWVWWTPPW
jgi:hypothetical protein